MRQWGLPAAHDLDRVVIVSPHLDDAVLSCARFMSVHPGCTVVTVFAGNPPEYPTDPMRLWDVQSGFEPGDDVMEARRHEDRAALAILGATPVHLDFVEHTYLPGDTPVAPEVLAPRLAETVRALDPTLLLIPFGLANPDHDVTHRACMRVRDELGDGVEVWCYEDTGYKHIPGMLAWRSRALVPSQHLAHSRVSAGRPQQRTQADRGRVLPIAAVRARRRLADPRQAPCARARAVLAPRATARRAGNASPTRETAPTVWRE